MKLLDTSVLIDLDNKPDGLDSSIDQLKEDHELFISAISVFEFWWGICIRYKGFHHVPLTVERKFYDFLSPFKLIPVNLEIGKLAASYGVDLQQSGQMIDLHDLYIAATGAILDIPVVTRNIDHFKRIKDINVIVWPFH